MKCLFECWKIFHEWVQQTSEIFFQHEKRNFVSPSGHVMFFYYINTNEIPNHFTLIVFWCEGCHLSCSHSNGDIFTCEDNTLFSHLKISSFRAKAHPVFHWCLCNKTRSLVFDVSLVSVWILEETLFLIFNVCFFTVWILDVTLFWCV